MNVERRSSCRAVAVAASTRVRTTSALRRSSIRCEERPSGSERKRSKHRKPLLLQTITLEAVDVALRRLLNLHLVAALQCMKRAMEWREPQGATWRSAT